MKKKTQIEDIQVFIKNWKKEFELIVQKVIFIDLGFEKSNGQLIRVSDKLKELELQNNNLKKLSRSTALIAKKYGIHFSNQKKKEILVPMTTGNLFRKVIKQLDKEILALNDLIHENKIKNSRIRINSQIAFELARAIHFCSGSQIAQESIKKLRENYFPYLVKVIIIPAKIEIDRWLVQQKKAHITLLKHTKDITDLAEIKSHLTAIKNEMRTVRRKKFVFSWAKKHITSNPRWSTHLKEHLIRSILSTDRSHIIKSFNTLELSRKKESLLAEMEKKNQKTLKQ